MPTMTIRRTAIPFAVAAVLLAGCGDNADNDGPGSTEPTDNGVSALAADEILERAKTALSSAKSYRMKGNVDADGQQMTLDLKIAGTDLGGTVSIGDASIELLAVGGEQYIRPDAEFWKMSAGAEAAENIVKLMGDKWAKVSAQKHDMDDLFKIADPDKLLKPDGTLTKGQAKDVNGVPAIGLVDGGEDGGTLYVATTGEPYPLLLQSSKASEGQVALSDFGATFDDVKAPDPAQVVDFDKLKSQ